MNRFEEIKFLINSIGHDFEKFYEKGNKTAGSRIRSKMRKLKILSQSVRMEISEMKRRRALKE